MIGKVETVIFEQIMRKHDDAIVMREGP